MTWHVMCDMLLNVIFMNCIMRFQDFQTFISISTYFLDRFILLCASTTIITTTTSTTTTTTNTTTTTTSFISFVLFFYHRLFLPYSICSMFYVGFSA